MDKNSIQLISSINFWKGKINISSIINGKFDSSKSCETKKVAGWVFIQIIKLWVYKNRKCCIGK